MGVGDLTCEQYCTNNYNNNALITPHAHNLLRVTHLTIHNITVNPGALDLFIRMAGEFTKFHVLLADLDAMRDQCYHMGQQISLLKQELQTEQAMIASLRIELEQRELEMVEQICK